MFFSEFAGAIVSPEVADAVAGLKDFYTTDETVRILGISKPTLFKKIREKKIEPYGDREPGGGRIGYRFKREEIEKYAAKNNIEPNWSTAMVDSILNTDEMEDNISLLKNGLETCQLQLLQLKKIGSANVKTEQDNELKEIDIKLKIKVIKGQLLSYQKVLRKKFNLLKHDSEAMKLSKDFEAEFNSIFLLLNYISDLANYADSVEKGEQISFEEYRKNTKNTV